MRRSCPAVRTLAFAAGAKTLASHPASSGTGLVPAAATHTAALTAALAGG